MLQDSGSFCQSCYKFWAAQGLEPKHMVEVLHRGQVITTDRKHIPVVTCPFCDGDTLLRLPKDNA